MYFQIISSQSFDSGLPSKSDSKSSNQMPVARIRPLTPSYFSERVSADTISVLISIGLLKIFK